MFRPLGAMAHLDYPFDVLRTYAGSIIWQPLVRFSKGIVLNLLRRIAVGQIVVRDSDGAVTICGPPEVKSGIPSSELRVLKETFWIRALLFADMVSLVPWQSGARSCCKGVYKEANLWIETQGFAESFMLGETSCSDLVAFFEVRMDTANSCQPHIQCNARSSSSIATACRMRRR